MDNEERIELAVRTAAKLPREDRITVAQRILETDDPVTGRARARAIVLTKAAERAVGERLDASRNRSSVNIRRFVSWLMREEGFLFTDIARALGRDHATVHHYIKDMRDVFSLPIYYHREIEQYNLFTEYADETEQVREQEAD